MKKIILTAIVAVAALAANAQVWVGGSFGAGWTNIRNNDQTVTQFEILPEIGYSLSENVDIAIALGDSYTKLTDHKAANSFVVEPYARYTFFNTGKVGFFVDGVATLKTGDLVSLYDVYENSTEWGVRLRPGMKFAASDKVTLVASLGGLGFNRNCEANINKFGFNANGNNLNFGVYYAF